MESDAAGEAGKVIEGPAKNSGTSTAADRWLHRDWLQKRRHNHRAPLHVFATLALTCTLTPQSDLDRPDAVRFLQDSRDSITSPVVHEQNVHRAYRGAGRPEAPYVVERAMDRVAAESEWIPQVAGEFPAAASFLFTPLPSRL